MVRHMIFQCPDGQWAFVKADNLVVDLRKGEAAVSSRPQHQDLANILADIMPGAKPALAGVSLSLAAFQVPVCDSHGSRLPEVP